MNFKHVKFWEWYNRKKENKMTEREQAIQEVKEARKHLERAEAKLKEAEVTYSIGDRFKTSKGKELLMIQGREEEVRIVELKSGRAWSLLSRKVVPDNNHLISQGELDQLRYGCTCTRYWDARKGEKV